MLLTYSNRIVKTLKTKTQLVLIVVLFVSQYGFAQYSSYNFISSSSSAIIKFQSNPYFNIKFLRSRSILGQTTINSFEQVFKREIVYYSIKDEIDNSIVSTDRSVNQYEVEKDSRTIESYKSYQMNFKFSNYLLQSDAFFNSFLFDVERKTFINDLTTKQNHIYTNEFPILEFQSVAAQQYWSGTKFWGGIGVAMIGVLMVTPKSITKWEEDYIENASSNLKRAFSEPPVWDEDHWEINYIGHPYAGALYYNTIRAQGGSMLNSFIFSAIISTGWEYVYEGVAERPSTQDLIVTPVAGAILGELIHQATLGMRRNGYSIFEAAFVTVFNPMYVILNGYN